MEVGRKLGRHEGSLLFFLPCTRVNFYVFKYGFIPARMEIISLLLLCCKKDSRPFFFLVRDQKYSPKSKKKLTVLFDRNMYLYLMKGHATRGPSSR